ncbi:hypothetical protein LWI28_006859 [Acer negundo]|uniref:Uncharacterized protein n=1 Tax=Acer negundo TaxID=4023 RepID=A0AAD5NGT6_ACENE|nr:hypothetical protein LWI28_006859 [Acer negundo]
MDLYGRDLPTIETTPKTPPQNQTHKSLTRLNLARNSFSKIISTNLFNATNLVSVDLSHNSLCGLIPDQIKTLQNLTRLYLSSNFLNVFLPDFLLDLKGLTGTPPKKNQIRQQRDDDER